MAKKLMAKTDVNLMAMAKRVVKLEGKKLSISIAQVLEVQHILLNDLSKLTVAQLADLMDKVRRSNYRRANPEK